MTPKEKREMYRSGYSDGANGRADLTTAYQRAFSRPAAAEYARGFEKGDEAYIQDQAAGLIP